MSSSSLDEVRTTTGTSLVRGSARIRCSTSIPSSLGSLRSSRTTAGSVCGSRPACGPVPNSKSTASWPSRATTTLLAMLAFRSARKVSSSSFGLSSTSMIIFSIIASTAPGAPSVEFPGGRLDRAGREELGHRARLTNVRSILRQSIGKRERYRRVGIAQQHVEFLAVARSDARPDAQVDVEVASLEQERRVHRLADLARHGENVVRTREIGREHRKGVSTEPRHGVAFAHSALQAVGDHSQPRVAGAVAVALVDQLEAIQVQDQQRRRPGRSTGVPNRLQGAVAEQVAVRQAGQRIVVRQILQARLVGLSLPYVARDRREEAYLAAGSPMRDDHL